VVGDVLDNGELHFVERAQTFEAAERRIEELAEIWPRQYVIYNKKTGERVFITAEAKTFACGVQIREKRAHHVRLRALPNRGVRLDWLGLHLIRPQLRHFLSHASGGFKSSSPTAKVVSGSV
jgi:hypothetical protein